MRYALVNNTRTLAARGLTGTCPGCGAPVDPRCGDQRVHHWAHRGTRDCDPWWEPETSWHRAWKGQFPDDWQEIIAFDDAGEKHIADVRTEHGLVLEFQHSRLDPIERSARERFHRNLLWVVDGTRLKRDYPRFKVAWPMFHRTEKQGFYLVARPDECFPATWLESTVPVVFDFRGDALEEPRDIIRETLWCLLPGRAEGHAVVVGINEQQFVEHTRTKAELLPAREWVEAFGTNLRAGRQLRALQSRSRNYTGYWPPGPKPTNPRGSRKKRRF